MEYSAFILLTTIVVSVLYGILSRTLTFLPFVVWTEELSRFSIITLVFLVSGLSIRKGIHVGLDLLLEKITGVWNKIITTIINILVIALLSIIMIVTFEYMGTTSQISPALKMPISYLYIFVVIGMALMIIELFCLTTLKWREE
ncbi:TRAP transporter small permease [Oceanobacillus damuensis]|uniref:TRAP transporter small permease n=1 Tax=Oceanobacillus damuensis TaxID=937928 RepID=UPI001F2771E5|nr:TRAP transporter small permease [Oceanobacillus damuensis]